MKITDKIRSILRPTQEKPISTRLRDNRNYIDCTTTVDALLRHCTPNVVYDIGAHTGDWSKILQESVQVDPYIVLFEPQKEYFNKLKNTFTDQQNKFFFNFALGSVSGNALIRGGGASASLLNASNLQHSIFPNSFNEEHIEETVIISLDEVIEKNNLLTPDVIKIDVQGFELDVFKGATRTLEKTKYIVAELSFVSLYKEQPELSMFLSFLEERKFKIIDFGYQWRNEKNEIIQIDAIFKKS